MTKTCNIMMLAKHLLFIVLSLTLFSCGNNCDKDELWREKVKLSDDTHIFIYHSSKCKKKRPFFTVIEKKIDFEKLKYGVFDICISERDADMLNGISKKNIADYIDYAYLFAEDDQDYEYYFNKVAVLDTTERKYDVYWSSKNEGDLVKLKHPISTYDLTTDEDE